MSKELDAMIQFAQQIVSVAPKLQQMESLDRRLSEIQKNINLSQQVHQQVVGAIDQKNKERDELVAKISVQANAIIDKAKADAAVILRDARNEADKHVDTAKRNAAAVIEGVATKQAELNELNSRTQEAQKVLDSVNAVLKKMRG